MYARTLFSISLLAVSLCSCSAAVKPETQTTPDLVQLEGGQLSWAGLTLGMSHAKLERRAGRPLPVVSQANPACGQFATVIPLYGRKLSLQWSAAGDEAVLDTLSVELPASSPAAPQLAARIRQRQPLLVEQDAPDGSVLLGTPSGQRVLIKVGKENFLLISPANCLD